MGRPVKQISERLATWLVRQPLYFVATAPLAADGHVNTSPKGGTGTFQVLNPTCVAYLDMTGSGSETIAHIRENGRITIMFCAFEGPPKVVRLYGRGSYVTPEQPEWAELRAAFTIADADDALVRAAVIVDVDRVQDSCGYVVPLMEVVGERDQMYRWAEGQERKHGACWDVKYRDENNRISIDGLPSLPPESNSA